MIPIISKWDSGNNGLARLNDCISCTVTEERNGKYMLEMVYPTSGEHYSLLHPGMTVMCKTNEAEDAVSQIFFIESVKPMTNGRCRVLANHCTYELNWAIIKPKTYSGTVDGILNGIYSDYIGLRSFPIHIRSEGFDTTQRTFTVDTARYVRGLLGGESGSIIEAFGGEWEWNNTEAVLHKSRGSDTGATILYGKNLTGAEVEWSASSYFDDVVAFWKSDDTVIVSNLITNPSAYASTKRAYLLDCSGDFDNAPTVAALDSKAQAYMDANKTRVGMSATVKFQPLWQTTEYKDIAALERVNLCDTVTVKHPGLGLDIKTKVTKTVYDVLKERYTSVSLGTLKKSFSDIVAER